MWLIQCTRHVTISKLSEINVFLSNNIYTCVKENSPESARVFKFFFFNSVIFFHYIIIIITIIMIIIILFLHCRQIWSSFFYITAFHLLHSCQSEFISTLTRRCFHFFSFLFFSLFIYFYFLFFLSHCNSIRRRQWRMRIEHRTVPCTVLGQIVLRKPIIRYDSKRQSIYIYVDIPHRCRLSARQFALYMRLNFFLFEFFQFILISNWYIILGL